MNLAANETIEIVNGVYDENGNFLPGTLVRKTKTFDPVTPSPNISNFTIQNLLDQVTGIDSKISALQAQKAEILDLVDTIQSLNPNN